MYIVHCHEIKLDTIQSNTDRMGFSRKLIRSNCGNRKEILTISIQRSSTSSNAKDVASIELEKPFEYVYMHYA